MFWLRGALVSMSVCVVVYACVSLLVGRWWRVMARLTGDSADALFALRTAPLTAATFIVAALSIPSFWRYEPRQVEEAIGPVALLLSAVFVALVVAGTLRARSALRQTNRCVREWTGDCHESTVEVDSPNAPPVALAGIRKSQLLISAAARSVLSAAEMERAIAHELSHHRARDNFKKLFLSAGAFPGMAALERAWLGAIELSADANAVRSHAEALDLASALVKIARLHDRSELPRLVSGFLDGAPASLESRIQRLLHWTPAPKNVDRLRALYASACALALVLACTYLPLLHGMHAFTEFLVR